MDAELRAAVEEIVRHQADAGVTVVNDGEAGKIGYSTYVKERLTGFGGEYVGMAGIPGDLAEYPQYMQRVMGGLDFEMPACVGQVVYRGLEAVQADIENLSAAVAAPKAAGEVEDVFMTAASPGVISVFLQNRHYASHEEYIAALADAMKTEYDAIHRAGLVLQLDCPDLAMTRQMNLSESLEDFRARARLHVEAINHATPRHPAGGHAHAPLLGQLRGSAPPRHPAARHHRHRARGTPRRRSHSRRPTPGTSTSGRCSRTSSCRRARS